MSQLNRTSSNNNWPCLLPSHDLKKMMEQSKMGLDSQVSLTKVDKSGNVKDGVWIQMNKFNLVKVQKATEESVGRDRKSTVKERFNYHNLTGVCGGEGLPIGSAPPDALLLWKNSILDHLMK